MFAALMMVNTVQGKTYLIETKDDAAGRGPTFAGRAKKVQCKDSNECEGKCPMGTPCFCFVGQCSYGGDCTTDDHCGDNQSCNEFQTCHDIKPCNDSGDCIRNGGCQADASCYCTKGKCSSSGSSSPWDNATPFFAEHAGLSLTPGQDYVEIPREWLRG